MNAAFNSGAISLHRVEVGQVQASGGTIGGGDRQVTLAVPSPGGQNASGVSGAVARGGQADLAPKGGDGLGRRQVSHCGQPVAWLNAGGLGRRIRAHGRDGPGLSLRFDPQIGIAGRHGPTVREGGAGNGVMVGQSGQGVFGISQQAGLVVDRLGLGFQHIGIGEDAAGQPFSIGVLFFDQGRQGQGVLAIVLDGGRACGLGGRQRGKRQEGQGGKEEGVGDPHGVMRPRIETADKLNPDHLHALAFFRRCA
ncbi:hypothetical protein D3C85_1168400 [compost metagenome]